MWAILSKVLYHLRSVVVTLAKLLKGNQCWKRRINYLYLPFDSHKYIRTCNAAMTNPFLLKKSQAKDEAVQDTPNLLLWEGGAVLSSTLYFVCQTLFFMLVDYKDLVLFWQRFLYWVNFFGSDLIFNQTQQILISHIFLVLESLNHLLIFLMAMKHYLFHEHELSCFPIAKDGLVWVRFLLQNRVAMKKSLRSLLHFKFIRLLIII